MNREPATLAERHAALRARIDAAARRFDRDPASIRLLAVTKGQPWTAIRDARVLGQRAFGENYLQEAQRKIQALAGADVEWHFIGPLQANKTRQVAAQFAWIHSLDRERVARRLSEQRDPALGPLQACIEVNVSGEASKSGVAPADLPALAAQVAALPGLALRGLMAMPAPGGDFQSQRAGFAVLARLFEDLRARGLGLDTLSMGTSQDLEAAIAEGATIVRVGTALFGPRRADG
ncbi:MAG: YggS family pyridoxal phosphate-dependent enzyme [Gammaproteobacteria bacterium]